MTEWILDLCFTEEDFMNACCGYQFDPEDIQTAVECTFVAFMTGEEYHD